jgi:FAD/FMN-containing dehydrogenase
MPSRREFLKGAGGAALGLGAAATIGRSFIAAPAFAAGGASGPAALAGADWAALAAQLTGQLVLPPDGAWTDAVELFNTRFASTVPGAVAFCETPQDVQASLAFARANGIAFRSRNGRHSYGGYSNCDGLIIDVSQMDAIDIAPDASTATIGAGAVLVDVYTALAARDRTIPGGTCPSVGVTGLSLGGGHGEVSRAFGMTCDSILSLDLVLADGSLVTASASSWPDLFWACRGGGGGNFGIVTSITFRLHPVDTVTLFSVDWAWADAVPAMLAWQEWVATLPDEVFTGIALITQPGGAGASPYVGAAGTFLGSPADLTPILAPLLAALTPANTDVQEMSWLEAVDVHAGCQTLSEQECHPTYWNPPGELVQNTWAATSAYIGESAPMPAEGVQVIVDFVNQRQADPLQPTDSTNFGAGGVGFDSYGGAMNRVAPGATAFVHRDSLALGQYLAYWQTDSPPDLIADNTTWLRALTDAITPYSNGEAYQNYIDPGLDGWLEAYYGANLPRLRQIKRDVDPDNVFNFAQSIPPADPPPTTTTTVSPAPVGPAFTG